MNGLIKDLGLLINATLIATPPLLSGGHLAPVFLRDVEL